MNKFLLLLISFFVTTAVYAMPQKNLKYNYTYDVPQNWTQTIKNSRVTELSSDTNKIKLLAVPLDKTVREYLEMRRQMFSAVPKINMQIEEETWSANGLEWTIEKRHYVDKNKAEKAISFVTGNSGVIYEVTTTNSEDVEQIKDFLKSFRFLQPKSNVREGNTIHYINPFKNYAINYPSYLSKSQLSRPPFDLSVQSSDEQTFLFVRTLFHRDEVTSAQVDKVSEQLLFGRIGSVQETGRKNTSAGEFIYKIYGSNNNDIMAISYVIINDRTEYNIIIISLKDNVKKERNYDSIIESFQFLNP